MVLTLPFNFQHLVLPTFIVVLTSIGILECLDFFTVQVKQGRPQPLQSLQEQVRPKYIAQR